MGQYWPLMIICPVAQIALNHRRSQWEVLLGCILPGNVGAVTSIARWYPFHKGHLGLELRAGLSSMGRLRLDTSRINPTQPEPNLTEQEERTL